jgi:phosphate transport system ATP-binding protein
MTARTEAIRLPAVPNDAPLPRSRYPLSFDVGFLSVSFHGKITLKDVAAAIPDRQVLAVIGPSGAGKSTFLRVLNRTLELIPQARVVRGEVHFKGENLYGRGVDARIVRKRIGMVHQKPLAFPLSIRENVLFGVRFHQHWQGRPKDEFTQTYLERAGLWEEVKDRLRQPASALSVGQLQRLCIARALANEPEALLMDEPCSALDPVSTARIEELILGLKEQLPVIIVTHNLAQARRIADRCLFLADGVCLEQGPADRIFTDPASARVRDFVTGKIG